MKFSEHWLRDWVNPPLSTNELVSRLTMAGLEVDSVEPVAPPFTNVVVGEVLSMMPHPHAPKLKVCQVHVGQPQPLTIVCGAANVQVGMRAPTVLNGAQLPNDLMIQETELRGVLSQGMLCSAKELGLGEESEGLLPLPDTALVGEDLRRALQLDDVSIEVDLTPNRGDCLGIEGIAREVSSLTRCPVIPVQCDPVAAAITDTFAVVVEQSSACPRYVGRILRNVNVHAPTPLWMKERLRRSGLRSISAVVDVTNYLLLELGQPMHAFDLAQLTGPICVRMAQAGEQLALLDGQTVTLDEKTLVIADQTRPQAIAGVMGGIASAVSDATHDIFLESAFFSPDTLAGCARRYGLHTDSSHRFERGVDPQLQRRAVERATALLLAIVGGQPGPVIEVVNHNALPVPAPITLRAARIKRLLGVALDAHEVTDILTRLGMTVEEQTEQWQVTPPSFRFDLTIEADLIEELARVHGYNHLPSTLPQVPLTLHPQPAIGIEQIQSVLVQRGYQEAITYSFVNPTVQTKINPAMTAVALANPLAGDMSVMRTTLWTGLLNALLHNQKRQQARVRLFEIGTQFSQTASGFQEQQKVAAIASGTRYQEQWGTVGQPLDFFDIKADVEALLQLTQDATAYHFIATTHPALHPGQAVAICHGTELCGLMGALHPRWLQEFELSPPVYLLELPLETLYRTHLPKFSEISKYPSIRRDIAISVAQETNAATVLDCIRQAANQSLIEMRLFDVYQGKGIESGKKSLAIGLIFQEFSRNLLESEVDAIITQILDKLAKNLGAQLRK